MDEHKHEDDKMDKRGVTRPRMKQKRRHRKEKGSHTDSGHHSMMSQEHRGEMSEHHHAQTLWVYWLIIMLGLWMIFSPLTFGYEKGIVDPAGDRELWLSLEDRITWMKWSDIVSGLLLLVFGYRALKPKRPLSLWLCCAVGIWLSIAPVIFWSPTAVGYLNNTFVGMLVIALTILIPGMPNMLMYMKMGSEVPPGWTYNPSSWAQRWIMIATGFIGFIVSRYLAAFQLGYIDHLWDPFFGNSSVTVLTSDMSHALPVSDAALGSLAYTFEFLMGFMGSPSRWRTMPWMVAFFGILVIPLGLVHIFLVISQPLVVGAWCTLCLLAAAIMLPMIPLEVDEVIAMGQHMVQAKRKGESMWKVFWKGGMPIVQNNDNRSPSLIEFADQPKKVFMASVWGMSSPWTLTISTIVGLVVIFFPAIFGVPIDTSMANLNHLCGSLVVVFAVISMGEVIRTGRFINILIGLTLAIAPWFMESDMSVRIADTICGLVVAGLSVPKGKITERYGLWHKYIR